MQKYRVAYGRLEVERAVRLEGSENTSHQTQQIRRSEYDRLASDDLFVMRGHITSQLISIKYRDKGMSATHALRDIAAFQIIDTTRHIRYLSIRTESHHCSQNPLDCTPA